MARLSIYRPPTAPDVDASGALDDDLGHVARTLADSRATGELVVRAGDLVGRLHFLRGQLAWVHCGGRGGFLIDTLVAERGLERELLVELLREVRQRSASFADFVVEQKLLDEEAMRETLRHHFRNQLDVLSAHSPPLQTLFLPSAQPYQGQFRFDIEEVLPPTNAEGLDGRLRRLGREVKARLPRSVAYGVKSKGDRWQLRYSGTLGATNERDFSAMVSARFATRLASEERHHELYWNERWVVFVASEGAHWALVGGPPDELPGRLLTSARQAIDAAGALSDRVEGTGTRRAVPQLRMVHPA